MKTKFINTEEPEENGQETVFTHCLSPYFGWRKTPDQPEIYNTVKYLGHCNVDGDMFSAIDKGCIAIFKGTKGDEFD